MNRFTSLFMTRANVARACIALAASAVALASGCNMFKSGDDAADAITTRPSTTQMTWMSDQPLPQALQPTNRPVVQGQLPLIYLVESECTIRVTNVATGEEIVTFPSKASQIVRVEPRGVMLANKAVIGATLAPGDYAIEVVPGVDAGTLHATQTITRSVPAAATKPAAPKLNPIAAPPTPVATPPTQ